MSAPKKVYTPDNPNPFVAVTQQVFDQLNPVETKRPKALFRVRRDVVVAKGLPFTELDTDLETTVERPVDAKPVDPIDVKPEIKE